MFAKSGVVGATDDVEHFSEWGVSRIGMIRIVCVLPKVLLGDCVKWPINRLQAISIIISFEVSFHIFVYPNLF